MTGSSDSLLGQVIGGLYRVEGLLGEGGMGAVYSARNLRTQGMFAVKVLQPGAAQDREIYARFRNEALVTSALRHPNIVQVIDFAELPDGRPYIIMEYLEGEDLERRLRRIEQLQVAQALQVIRQVGRALHAAHRLGVVHRDLKPSNIFLVHSVQHDEAFEHVKVIDFGVSRIQGRLGQPPLTRDTHTIGTPAYMSPEAALGLHARIDGRSDQFSLALILYQMLSGQLPFGDSNAAVTLHLIAYEPPPPLEDLMPGLPPPLLRAVQRAMSKRQEDRFDTILDFVQALDPEGAASSRSSALSAMSAREQRPGRRPRVLIVDDEEDLTALLRSAFEPEGYVCRVVKDSVHVLDAVREFLPDLIILDIALPGKSGYKLCWEIKSEPALREIPVILLSAKVQDADHKLGMAMHADAYVDKPVEIAQLIGVIEEHLSRHR